MGTRRPGGGSKGPAVPRTGSALLPQLATNLLAAGAVGCAPVSQEPACRERVVEAKLPSPSLTVRVRAEVTRERCVL